MGTGVSNIVTWSIQPAKKLQNGARMLPIVSPPANGRNVLTLPWSIAVQERHEPVDDLPPPTWLQPNPDRSCTSLAGLPIVQHQADVAEKSR